MADISKASLRKEINAILKNADLSNTTAKKVRLELEEKLDCNLSSRRKEIDALVMEFVNKQDQKRKTDDASDDEEEGGTDEENDATNEEEEASEEEVKSRKTKRAAPASTKKPVKKSKPADDSDDDESGSVANSDDALSEEEYSPKKAAKPKGRKPARGRKKKGSDSDSDDDWNKSKKLTKKGKPRKSTAFTRPYKLSPELSKLMGSKEPMPRHEVIKKIWAMIKERNLYDPDNKQFAICDDELLKVMGVKRFRTFGMMKYLKNHFLD